VHAIKEYRKRYMALLTLAPDVAERSASRPDRLTLEEGRILSTQLIGDCVGPNNHIKDVTVYYKDEWTLRSVIPVV